MNTKPSTIRSILALLPALLPFSAPWALAQTSYNAAADFALTQGGTTGTWFYGNTASDSNNTFIPYVLSDNPVSPCGGGVFQRWYDPVSGDLTPQIARNNTAVSCNSVGPEALFLHPGPTGKRSVLRWTAPAAGTFQVSGVFGKQNPSATADIKILINATGTPLFSGNLTTAYQHPFDFPVTVAAADTLDFSVGWGNGSFNSDGSTLAVTIGTPVSTCQPPPANQQVWLPGENSVVDVQSGETRGTLAGDATYGTGKVGRGFKLDGAGDYVVIPDNAAQRMPVDAVTLEGWFKFNSVGGVVSLISKPLRNSALNSYTIYLENGALRGLIGNASQYTRALSSYGPPLNAWTHLAFTFSRSGGASTLKLYANGIEVTSGTDGTNNIPITYDADPFPLLIGGEYENNGPAFVVNGEVDEPSVYSRALTQPEIQALVRQGSFGKCPPEPLPLQPVPAMPPADQIASWTADGDARDFTGLNPTGILRGDVNYRVGRVGQAFNLDGNGDYIEVADNANHRPVNQLTVEGWYKFNNFNNLPHLIGKGLRGNDRDSYVMWHANGNIRIGYSDSGTNFIFYDTGFAPKAGEFNHYAMVLNTDDTGVNANTFKLYVNGKQVFSGAAGAPIYYDANPHPLTIGVDVNNDIFDYPLSGQVDEVSLYSRALTASEIAGIYNAGTAGKLKSKATAAGSNVATQLSDTTITFASVSTTGVTTQSGIDLGLLPPLPSNVVYTGLAYDLSTSAVYQNARRNDVVVAFNAAALPAAKFNQLRILHLENGAWVNRTDRTSAAPLLRTNNLKSLSPFVIVEAEAAFTGLVDQYTAEDTPKSYNFEVTDPGTITAITATSSNGTIVPNNPANLTVTGSGTTRTVNVTPAADQNGELEITVTIARGSLVLSDTITLTVTEVNDVPVPASDALSPVAEDSAQRTIPFATLLANDGRGPANESGQILTITTVANAAGGVVTISGTNVLFTPAADFNGTGSFSYTLQDNGTTDGAADPRTSTTGAVSFAITEVNDVPTAAGDSLTDVPEDSATRTISFANLTGNDSTGPANESSQTLLVAAVSDPVGGTVSISGTDVLFTPALNFNGVGGFSYTVVDNGTTNGAADFLTGAPAAVSFNVTAVNDAPSFTKGADQTLNEDAGAQTVTAWSTSISPGPADEAGQTVTFSVTNDNNALFAAQPAIAANGTLTFTLAANANGTATVTVGVSDNGGTANGGQAASAIQTFTITVSPVNDAPSFSKGADQSILEDAAAQTVTAWAAGISPGPADEAGQTVTFSATNNNNALFSAQPVIAANGTLTFTPAANANGTATVTVGLSDNGGTANGGQSASATQSFTITLSPVNDAPSFTKGAGQTLNEDAGARTVTAWAAGISPGPADEAGQTVAFSATNNNNALFSAQPAIGANGTLTFTPAANANGTATVTVGLSDNGGTANGGQAASVAQTFTITVSPVNDSPSFTKGVDQSILEDAGAKTVTAWSTGISPGPTDEAGQTVTFSATNNNNALFAAQPAIAPNGTLTFTPAANANGTSTITVGLSDNGGTTNGGQAASATQSFTITVSPVNDRPVFNAGTDQLKPWNPGAQSVANWATPISAGPSDESGQILQFTITGNSNPGLFSIAPGVSPDGTLTYTPALNVSGSATLSLVLSDNGGTANGGQDTSTIRSFTISIQDEYTSWQQQYFTPAEWGNPAIGGPLADADSDGSSNLLEYAVGRNPRMGDGSPVTVGKVLSGGREYLALSYTRTGPSHGMMNLTVERATSLSSGIWFGGQVVQSVVAGPGALETVTVRSNQPISPTSPEFLRLKVTQP